MDNSLLTSSAGVEISLPRAGFLEELEAKEKLGLLIEQNFARDFPFLTDPQVRRTLGNKGTPFGEHSLPRRLFWDPQREAIIGLVYFSHSSEGPSGAAHGGAIATALDSALGNLVMRLMGFGCVTLTLTVDYKKFVPVDSTVRIECTKQRIEGRKAFVQAELRNLKGDVLHARATAIFYKTMPQLPDYDGALKLFGCQSNLTKQELIESIMKHRQGLKKHREMRKKRAEEEGSNNESSTTKQEPTDQYKARL
jgi:acyl-coenzyme A thioesterase PaaI-like protein